MRISVLAVIGSLLLLTGCSSGRPADCLTVPADKQQAIADGVKDDWAMNVTGAAAYATPAGNYMVALRFDNPKLQSEETGVWLLTSLDDTSPIAAVDAMAALYTNWPHTINGKELSITMDGASEAERCL